MVITTSTSVCALKCTILVYFFRTLLWEFIFLHVARFSCCTLFMLHFFHTAPFPCCTFLCSNFFMLHFFSCCTLIMNCFISYCTFTRYNVFVLHSSHVALFACCNFFLLHFVHFALFPEVLPGSPQPSTMERFATVITKVVKLCCKVLHLRCFWDSGYASVIFMLHLSMLHFFSVALFPCCTFSMSHFFHVALFSFCIHVALFSLSMLHSSHVALGYYWKILKMNGRQKTETKSDLTLSTVNFFHFYFDILSHVFCHYIVLNGW